MATQKKYSQEFKNDAVEYRKSHAELSLKTCAANLGVSPVSLREWIKATDDTGKMRARIKLTIADTNPPMLLIAPQDNPEFCVKSLRDLQNDV